MPNEDDMPLLVYADKLVDKLREMLPVAIKESDETAVHHSRVATRKLKAAADVFKTISQRSHRRDFVKTLRKLRQHLGPARDLDVMIGHLQEIHSDRLKPGTDWLLQQLLQKQEALRQSEAREFDVPKALARLGAWWGVRQDWVDAGDGLHCLVSESLHLQLDEFIEHADAVAGKRAASPDANLMDPHQLRIAGKALRYTLEMAVEAGHELPAAVARGFKKMQDALGLWHDYVVLTECVLKLTVQTELGLHDSSIAAAVLDIAKLAVRRAQTQLSRFNKLWMARGETLASTIRHAFPLTHPAPPEPSESQMDPDPTETETPPGGHPQDSPSESSAA